MKPTCETERPQNGRNTLTHLHFSTQGKEAPFVLWRSVQAALFDSYLSTPSEPGFTGHLTVYRFETFLLCRSIASGGRYLRTQTRLAWDGIDHLAVSYLQHGKVTLDDPAIRLRPGDVTVQDLAAPTVFAMTEAKSIHLIVPRAALPASVASAAPEPCRILSGRTAVAILLRGLLETLIKAARYLTSAQGTVLGASVPDFIARCIGPAAGPARTGNGDLGRRLRRYVEENLNRKDMTPSRLAREFGVSRSQLYRQFETTGGVEAFIRRRRLHRALLVLCDPRQADRRIADIAYETGFADEAYFSRRFRQAFGRSPREARIAALQGDRPNLKSPPLVPADGTTFADWLRTLGTG